LSGSKHPLLEPRPWSVVPVPSAPKRVTGASLIFSVRTHVGGQAKPPQGRRNPKDAQPPPLNAVLAMPLIWIS
jgi:hypothetical protein